MLEVVPSDLLASTIPFCFCHKIPGIQSAWRVHSASHYKISIIVNSLNEFQYETIDTYRLAVFCRGVRETESSF